MASTVIVDLFELLPSIGCLNKPPLSWLSWLDAQSRSFHYNLAAGLPKNEHYVVKTTNQTVFSFRMTTKV